MAQNGIGAIIEQLERWDNAATMDPDEGGEAELGWQLAGQLDARIVPRQGREWNIKSFLIIFDNRINRNFFIFQYFIRKHNWGVKNCLSQGKISVFSRLCAESSEEHKG
jgi:hypothetical protein